MGDVSLIFKNIYAIKKTYILKIDNKINIKKYNLQYKCITSIVFKWYPDRTRFKIHRLSYLNQQYQNVLSQYIHYRAICKKFIKMF